MYSSQGRERNRLVTPGPKNKETKTKKKESVGLEVGIIYHSGKAGVCTCGLLCLAFFSSWDWGGVMFHFNLFSFSRTFPLLKGIYPELMFS